MSFTPEAMAAIESYEWPGNVREMENLIERTVTLTDGTLITTEDLPPDIGLHIQKYPTMATQVSAEGLDMNHALSTMEQQMIEQALNLSNGVKARAATLLGINRTTLVEKIKRLGMD